MRRLVAMALGVAFALSLLAPATVYAAEAPPNDMFANATQVTAFPFTTSADNTLATTEGDEPHGCSVSLWRTVWYAVTAPAAGTVTVDPAGSTVPDSDLVVYRPDGSGLAGLTYLGCAYASPLTFEVVAGATYYIQAYDAYMGGGTFHLSFGFTPTGPVAPPNDMFANATPILANSYTDTVDNRAATVEPLEKDVCTTRVPTTTLARTAWYRFSAVTSGSLTWSVAGSEFADPKIASYYQSTGPGLGGLSTGYCPTGTTYTVPAASVVVGRIYYFQVSDYGSGGGRIHFALTFTPSTPTSPPPANDMFATATPVGTLPAVDISGATREPLERDPCTWGFTRSVWYRYDATASGALAVDMTGTGFADPRVTAYFVSTGPGLDGLSSGRCGPSVPVVAGRTYYFQITDAGSGGGALRVAFTFLPAPANDSIGNATTIAGLPYSDTSTDTRSASRETGEPSACGTYSRTVWYRYSPAEAGVVTIDGIGSSFSAAVLAVYRGATPDFTGLSVVACENTGSPLVARLEAGSTYWIQASADGTSAGGMLAFHVTSTPDAVPAPPNDFFAAATVVSAFPFVDNVDLTRATLESDEQTGGCWDYFAGSVWYTFVAPADGAITLEGSHATGSVLVNAYRAASPGITGLSSLGYNACSGVFPVEAGARYYLQVASAKYATPGSIEIHLSQAPRPANDDVASAKVVTGGTLVDSVDVRTATSEPGEPHQCGGTSRTVWYAITAPTTGTVRVGAGGWDPVIGVYRTSEPGFAGLTPLTCTHTQDAPLTFTAAGGATYYIQMSDWYTTGNVFEIHITFVDTTPPAVSITGAAASYAVDARIAIAGRATDLVDPAPVIACSLAGPGGAAAAVPCAYSADAWSLGALGTYTFTATATDAAGNTGAASASFDIVATYPSARNITKLWTKKATVTKDLVAILDSAASAERRGQFTAEANKIAEFRAAVKAQSGKAIDADKAALLVAFSYGL